ncbi:MAG: sulfite exporter TauE/SafE family protein [Thermoflexales bacterium]|nr:sulfite exporter TauE/SafE family protein [Thermoflexales bacterium]MDW8350662.1 sulfite exporter TauE/SafE family protein [Anaerolineae bacterium]
MSLTEFLLFVLAGFIAQIVDGALGMAYGVTASSLLISLGVPPAVTSATVHAAECFTTGASALSHRTFGNVDGALVRRLLLPGVIGAVLGAYVLSHFPGDALRPYVAAYLMLMGFIIVFKAFRQFPPQQVTSHLIPLGFIGAFVDAVGSGGWGPIVASNLIVRGNDIRKTIGSVNVVEFFVTLAASATFLVTLGLSNWPIILALALGGVLAAPLAAWVAKHIPVRPFMVLVGALVVLLSLRTLLLFFGLI